MDNKGQTTFRKWNPDTKDAPYVEDQSAPYIDDQSAPVDALEGYI